MISDNTSKLLLEVSSCGNRPIINFFDVGLLIEYIGQPDNLNELIFTSKFLTGLRKILGNKVSLGNEPAENIRREFNDAIMKLRNLLEKFTSNLDLSQAQSFKQKYLLLNQQSVASFFSIAEDLSLYKEYLNRNKYHR